MLNFSSIEANSLSGDGSLTKVYKFTPTEPELLDTRGDLVAVVTIKASPEVDLESLMAEILQNLNTSYYQVQGDSFNLLRKSVEKVQNEFADRAYELNIIVTSYNQGVIYSAVLGLGEVLILRRGMIANILSGKGPIIVASGYPEEEDLLILGTSDFFLGFASNELKQFLEEESFEEVGARLQAALGSKNLGKSGILILKFSNKNVTPNQDLVVNPEAVLKTPLVSQIFNNIKSRLQDFVPKRNIFVKTQLEDREDDSKKKTTITVGIILLVLLLISIGFGVRQRSVKLSKSKYEGKLTQAVHDFDEANSLISLDSSRSRELFLSAQETAKGLEEDGVKDPALVDLLKKMESSQSAILKEFKDDPKDFVDLSLLSSGFKGTDLSSSGEEIFVLDSSSRKVVQVSIENKKTEVVAGPESFTSGSLIASYEDRFFVLTSDEIKELGDENGDNVPKDWSDPALIYAYAGNLYVLDKSVSTVSRYPGVEAGFASKQNWFGAGVVPDLSGATSWVIDGNVWVLTSSGKILKFSLGSPQAFSISGIGQALNNPVNLYTNENLEYIYVLDPQNSRMVVVEKDGVYKAQYVSGQLKDAKDLVVSEKDKRAVILIGGNLKLIELKHL